MAADGADRAGPSRAALTARLAALIPGDGREHCAAAFVRSGETLQTEVLASGSAAFVGLRMRQVVERALMLGADGLVMGHNHPSGNPLPSDLDLQATARLRAMCGALDLDLVDHLIFAAPLVYSMKTGATSWICQD